MARNRQRAKQRQAERRAARLRDRGGDGSTAAEAPAASPETAPPSEDPAASGSDQSLLDPPSAGDAPGDPTPEELEAGAPPQETGRSDTVLESPPPAPLVDEQPEEEEEYDFEDEEQPYEPETAGPRGRRGEELAHEERRGHGRVLTFFLNVWAELQRVQWPDRQAVITLTGVVLGFVLLAGGYLGLLDAIFSRVIERVI